MKRYRSLATLLRLLRLCQRLKLSRPQTALVEGVAVDRPDAVVSALLAEAGANGSALLLDDRPFVCDGLGCADIAYKLFHCREMLRQTRVAIAGSAGTARTGAHLEEGVMAQRTGRRLSRGWIDARGARRSGTKRTPGTA